MVSLTLARCQSISVSATEMLIKYVRISPFCCATRGGSHESRRDLESTASASMLRGVPLGTIQESRTGKIPPILALNFM